LYFFKTSRKRSCGKAITCGVDSSHGFGAIMALTMASSVDCTVARNSDRVVVGAFSGLDAFVGRRFRIRGREGYEDVSRAVAGIAAVAAERESFAARRFS